MSLRRLAAISLVGLLLALTSATAVFSAELEGLTSTSPATAGGIGGFPGANALCPEDQVIVGIAITAVASGSASPGFNFYCRALDEKGLLDSDPSTAANSSLVSVLGSGQTAVFCPVGHVAIGVQFVAGRYVSGAGLICSTPPKLNDVNPTAIIGSGTSTSLTCPSHQVLVGFNLRTSDAINRLGGYCSSFRVYRLFYATNGGIGKVPSSINIQLGENVALADAKSLTRAGYAFQGWTDGTNIYQPGDTYYPKGANVMISALWKLLPPPKPDPPVLDPGVGEVTVEVKRPENSAGVSYYLVSLDDRLGCTIRAPENSCIISGLTGGREYSFTVVAGNEAGRSVDSDPVSVRLYSSPSSPGNISVSGSGSTATVTWDPPKSDGGSPVLSYLVEAIDSTSSRLKCQAQASETSCAIEGLRAGTSYRFRVTAVNEAGESASVETELIDWLPVAQISTLKPATTQVKPVSPADDPEGSLDLLVAAFSLLLVATTLQQAVEKQAMESKELAEIDSKFILALDKSAHWGDRSRSWQLVSAHRVESFFRSVAERTYRFTEIIGRVFADGSYIRAMFGGLYLALPLVGVALGVLAADSAGKVPQPPTTGFMIAAVALATIDAFSGFVAALTFALSVLLTHGLTSTSEALTMLGLAAVMFAPPLIASNVRPFRRHLRTREDLWERVADYALGALFGGWAVSKMIVGLPILAEREFDITGAARMIGAYAAIFILLRLALEELAQWGYPARLVSTSPAESEQWKYYEIATPISKTAVFAYLAIPFIGTGWELWLGAAIFFVSDAVGLYEGVLPRSQFVQRWLPKGALKTLVMIFIGFLAANLLERFVEDPIQQVSLGFVLLALPAFFIKLLTKVADAGHDYKSWRRTKRGVLLYRFGGVLVFIALVIHVFLRSLTTWLPL